MRRKFIFLVIIFLSFTNIAWSDYTDEKEKELDSLLKYIGNLYKITLEQEKEFNKVLEVYNILLEQEVEKIEKEKLVNILSSQILKFKDIKKDLYSYKMSKNLDFYLVLLVKTSRDITGANIENTIKVCENLIEYINTKDKKYFEEGYNLLKNIFEFSF